MRISRSPSVRAKGSARSLASWADATTELESPLSARALETPTTVACLKNTLRDIPDAFSPAEMTLFVSLDRSMISLLGMDVPRSWSVSIGFFCGPTGTPNSLDMLRTLTTNWRIGKCQKYFFRVLGTWRLHLAAARSRYVRRQSEEITAG